MLFSSWLCVRASSLVESSWCEVLSDACTQGEENDALAAAFIRLAFMDALLPTMLEDCSDENNRPPNSTRREKNWPRAILIAERDETAVREPTIFFVPLHQFIRTVDLLQFSFAFIGKVNVGVVKVDHDSRKLCQK